MSKKLEFIFDFGSPNAYLAFKALPPILDRANADLVITPSLLGGIFKLTGNKPPMLAFGEVKGRLAYEQLEIKRFTIKNGLTKFKFNSHFPVNSLILMRGALLAKREDRLMEYVEAGLKAMWEDDKKMDDPQVYAQVMTEAGFDGAGYLQQMQSSDVKEQLSILTSETVERGVFGIPTFFIGDEMFFGKDRLNQVEEELNR